MITRSILFVLMLFGSCQALAELQVYANADSFSYSEPVTIKAAFNQLQGDFRSGEVALTHGEAEMGASYNNWSLGFLARYDLYSRFHSETAELLYLSENELPVELGRSYQLQMDVNRSRSTGLKLAYDFAPFSSFRGQVAVSYLKSSQLLDGNISGVLTTNLDGRYSGQGRIDYVYDEDLVLERQVEAPTGEGATLDFSFNWRLNDALALDVDLQDLYSRIVWEDAPHTLGRINSNVIELDENGVIENASALYSAIDSFQTFNQRLPRRETVTLNWSLSDSFDSGIQLFRIDGLNFPRLQGSIRAGENTHWKAMYDFKAQAVGLGFEYGYVRLFLLSDNIDPSDAHTFAFNASIVVPL